MVVTKNSVNLDESIEPTMKPKGPEYISVDELFARFPAAVAKGWTKKELQLWVSQRIFWGRNFRRGEQLEIDAVSFEKFLNYHNELLRETGVDMLQATDDFKKKKTPRRRPEED